MSRGRILYALVALSIWSAGTTLSAQSMLSVEGVAMRHAASDVSDLFGIGATLRSGPAGVVLGFQYLTGNTVQDRVLCGSLRPPDFYCPLEPTTISSKSRLLLLGYSFPIVDSGDILLLFTPTAAWSHAETSMRGHETGRTPGATTGGPRLESRLDVSRALVGNRLLAVVGSTIGISLTDGTVVQDGSPPHLSGRHRTLALHAGVVLR